ncbi:threonyl-tRNA synthetase [Clarireedia jacksonii]
MTKGPLPSHVVTVFAVTGGTSARDDSGHRTAANKLQEEYRSFTRLSREHLFTVSVMISRRTLRIFRNGPSYNSRYLRQGYGGPQIAGSAITFSRSCASYETAASKVATSTKTPPTPPADHRQLAIDQELFINSRYSPGSPLFLPNGTRMFKALTQFLSAQYEHFGFEEVITPTIYKKSLWETSGHWENYAEDMYSVTGQGSSGENTARQKGEDEEYGLKPMNCPGHCLIFASKQRSYRDLPIRYTDFSPLHRNEISGALSGLTRVRRFHQDDGHIFCRPSQIENEISKSLEFVRMVYTALSLGSYRLALSTRPKDHYIGTTEEWDNAESALKQALNTSGQEWTINEGDGAFYGPKIDIILKDSDGKEHQTATIQLDFQLPKRFELEYQAPAPELESKGQTTDDAELLSKQGPVTPVLIHRAILGSVERMMALLIEHYNGHYPFWLNPRKVIILTVNDEKVVVDWAKRAKEILTLSTPLPFIRQALSQEQSSLPSPGGLPWPVNPQPKLPVDLDDSPRSLGKKISEAKRKRYGAIIVVGAKNAANETVTVDLSSIPDRFGFLSSDSNILQALSNRRSESATKQQLQNLAISPQSLRHIFDGLLHAYQ